MPSRRPAFTLLELILVVAIVAVLAGVLLPYMQPAVYDQLRSTAQIVATDLAYARSLAVANNDNYCITFDLNDNQYILTHSGTNGALNTLVQTPFSSLGDPPTKHIVDLDNLPHSGPAIRLAAVATTGTTTQSVNTVEFGPLGQTINADPTTIWLMAGGGVNRRYMTLVVNAVTGIVQVGGYSTSGPPAGVTQIQ